MKKIIYICFSFILLFTLIPKPAIASPPVSASSAILMDQNSGRVLYGKDPHEIKRIASITKIMTAILAIESDKLEDDVKISDQAVRAEGSSIFLKPGEKMKLEDLVYGLMLRSGNDAAVAIAEHVGGSQDGFVLLMNQKAREIGMKNTHFANPHGLDDHENHFSTAYDMALLTKYAMQNKKFRQISGTKVHRAPLPDSEWQRVWNNKNRLLTEKYEYCTGGKTGYTKRAKRTLVTTATKGDLDLIAVTLNAPDDWNDHIGMFEYGFDQYHPKIIVSEGVIKKVKHPVYKNKVFVKNEYIYPLKPKEEKKIRVEYKMLKPKKQWEKGKNVPDTVGKVVIYFNESPVKTMPIYYKKGKQEEKKDWKSIWKNLFYIQLGVRNHG